VITKAIIECLHTLLLYHPEVSCNEKFVEFGWPIICEKLFDEDQMVCHEAFEALRLLFEERETPGSSGKIDANSSHFRSLLEKTYTSVVLQLGPRYDTILEKFRSLPTNLQEPAISLVGHLSSVIILKDKTIACISSYSTTRQQDIVYNLIRELQPLLDIDNPAIVYQTGVVIIHLAKKLRNFIWFNPVITSFGILLSNFDASCTSLTLIHTLLSILPNLSTNQLIKTTLIVFKSAHQLDDVVDRIYILTKTLGFILSMSVKQGTTKYLSQFLSNSFFVRTFSGAWNSCGEEIILAAASCCNSLYETHHAEAIPAIIVLLQCLLPTICFWNLSPVVYTQCLSLINFLGSVHNEAIQPLMEYLALPESLNNIENSEKFSLILLVLVKHIKSANIFPQILKTLQTKFQFQEDNQVAANILSAHKEGHLGIDTNPPSLPGTGCMETILHVFSIIFTRGGIPDRKQIISMVALILERETNPCVISHCKLLIKRIEAHQKGANTFSPNFFISEALSRSESTEGLSYRLARLLAAQKNQIKTNITTDDNQLSWTQLAGTSSPIDIQIAHKLKPKFSTMDLFLRIRNHTDIPITNFKVLIGIQGSVECLSTLAAEVSKTFTVLGYRETTEWNLTFLLKRFEYPVIKVRTVFMNSVDSAKENHRVGYVNLVEFQNNPYPLRPSLLLRRVPHTCAEFMNEWNLLPVGFHFGAKAVKGTPISTLLDSFANLEGFHSLPPRLWDSDRYFQMSFVAISWFRDQISCAVTGEYDDTENTWIARFEFRGSSGESLSVFHSYAREWLKTCTNNLMFVLDDDAPEDIFKITRD